MSELEQIKKLVGYSDWPSSVYPELICDVNSEDEKKDRAKQIKNIMLDDLTDKKFLDFGCGEGHVSMAIGEIATTSVGYDIIQPKNESTSCKLTASMEEVAAMGPYDNILLYDVLDHCEDPEQVLKNVKQFLAPNGKIIVRCHPWCGRHGGHLYREINKSHIHLILTEEELKQLGVDLSEFPKQKVIYPIATYKKWFESAGLVIKNQNVVTEAVPLFLKNNPLIKKRLTSHWQANQLAATRDWPEFQLSQSFHDYILEANI